MDDVTQIRKDLEESIGMTVILRADKGRKRIVIREGILESAYPDLFVVKIANEYDSVRRVSYTYSDVLTSTVEVTICENEEAREYALENIS